MADYIIFNTDGKIIGKHISVDGFHAGLEGREDVLKVSRQEAETVNQYWLVDKGKLLEMTKEEKTAYDDAVKAERDAVEAETLTLEKLVDVLESKEVVTKTEILASEISRSV